MDVEQHPLLKLEPDKQQQLVDLVQNGDVDAVADATGMSRRSVILAAAALGVGAIGGGVTAQELIQEAQAAASTTDGDGNVGTPQNPVDLFADGVQSNSLNTEDVDVGQSDFVSTGDFVYLIQANYAEGTTTTSSSYSPYNEVETELTFAWDDVFSGNVQGQCYVSASLFNNNDAINFRIQNTTDGETVIEQTGITGGSQNIAIGPVDYTPTTTSNPIVIQPEFSNQDNSTGVDVFRVTYGFGVGL